MDNLSFSTKVQKYWSHSSNRKNFTKDENRTFWRKQQRNNGNVFYDTSISYYYTNPGSYEVSLTAFDTLCNKVETISETVYYAGNFHTDNIIPNIFTPNNDGENDELTFIKANDTKEFSITIFTRWGGVIYQSHNANISWDGTNPGGQNASNGIYYYEIKYIDICSEEEILETGFIHLIR